VNLVINPQAPLPIYAQLMEQIRELIVSGHLKPGETLPSVRQLAETLEVNSLTIQKAYKGLEASGYIAIKKGVGAFVRDDVTIISEQSQKANFETDLKALLRKAQSLNISKDELLKLIDQQWES
jgi:GntR family transcriptional regulator